MAGALPPRLVTALLAASASASVMLAPPANGAAGAWLPGGRVGAMPGPEDLALFEPLDGAPQILVSSDDRRGSEPGGIWSFPTGAEPRRLFDRAGDGEALHPHGIAVTRLAADGIARLFVVHHAPPGAKRAARHRVEIFRLDGESPGWEASLSDREALPSPNDLVATPSGDLYVTNEVSDRGVLRQALEFLRLRTSSFVAHGRYSPGSPVGWERAAQGPRLANGVEVDDERLFVAATLDRQIWVFARDPGSGRVGPVLERVSVGSGVDNLTWGTDSEGRSLWTAAHPDLWAFLRYRANESRPSPSEVWRFDPDAAGVERLRRVFHDPGEGVAAVATALLFDGDLYLGQVFGRGVVRYRSAPNR